MALGWLGVVLLVGALALYLALRVAETIRRWREPTTRWVRRSPVDRRQHRVHVAVERRRGPRRQEDLARAFLAGLPRRRYGSRSSSHPSTERSGVSGG